MKGVYLFPVLLLIFLSACGGNGKTHIRQAELMQLIESGNAPVIIDVRSDSEYAASHVPGAIHIPFWSAFSTDQLDDLTQEELLVLYCEHGPRAGIAKFAFSMDGFDNLVYLEGHMSGWKQAGLPVDTEKAEDSSKN